MSRYYLLIVLITALLLGSCRKNNTADNEAVLYGAWVNTSHPGDTLHFINKNNKNILRYNVSLNAVHPAYEESEYSYADGKLSVAVFGAGTILHSINSFTWKQPGQRFEVQGIQLFMIMSSSSTYFTYRKVD
jgi:hypothetical protein